VVLAVELADTRPLASDLGQHVAPWIAGMRATPLDPGEESSPAATVLARRFAPALALPNAADPWPVSVSYAWQDSDLMARVVSPAGEILHDQVALPRGTLHTKGWDHLPVRDPQGNRIEYWVDAPGDDRLEGGTSHWRRRWRALGKAGFPPTQYAHLFWVDRELGVLAIQYWFFYPFNEWINHHEGDWEHVNVILQGSSHLSDAASDKFRPVSYQFFFHAWSHEPTQVMRVGGDDPREDHVVVFAGGRGRFLWWSGTQSGGSYPLPAVFPGASDAVGPLAISEDTSRPQRFIPASDFRIVVLPEPDRLDTGVHPELSWLRLPFYAGQRRVFGNPPLIERMGGGDAPLQPAQRSSWNALRGKPPWKGKPEAAHALAEVLPQGWRLLAPLR
jgi:hypothetical protein